MIVRILDDNQYSVADDEAANLEYLDGRLLDAVNDSDDAAFEEIVGRLIERVHLIGRPVATGHLGASDLVVPGRRTARADVVALLAEEDGP